MKKALLPLIVFFFLVGCSSTVKVTGKEKEDVLLYAEPMTNNLFEAFNKGDFKQASVDFDEKMKNAMTKDVFTQNRDMIIFKIGKYKKRTLSDVFKNGSYIIVLYNSEFEKEKDVVTKIVFSKYVDRNLISGWWLDSPKLRK